MSEQIPTVDQMTERLEDLMRSPLGAMIGRPLGLDDEELPHGDKQRAYKAHRRLYREQWEQSDAEDFCARKEVEPGTYKWLSECLNDTET